MLENMECGIEISSLHLSVEEHKGKAVFEIDVTNASQIHERERKDKYRTLHDIDPFRHNAN